jgi:hypothetical protein
MDMITVDGKSVEEWLMTEKQVETRKVIEETTFEHSKNKRRVKIKDRTNHRRKVYKTKVWNQSEIDYRNWWEQEQLPLLRYHVKQELHKRRRRK